jgi:hypothetical protein
MTGCAKKFSQLLDNRKVLACNTAQIAKISLALLDLTSTLIIMLKGLSHEMDLAFDDVHGQFTA